jgi:hypothetical protein
LGEVKEFISGLVERFNKENDLSDVTYAMCRASGKFRRFFLKYCFDKKIDTDDLTREFDDKKSSIPDFYFHESGNERIIEVKIYDGNQHFEQYEKDFPGAEFSFIANYDANYKFGNDSGWEKTKEKWKIKTWKGFCAKLEESPLLGKSSLTESDFLVRVYLKFLREVIKMPEFKEVNIGKVTDLPKFYGNLENIFVGAYGFTESTSAAKYCTQGYYGRAFQKKDLWFWTGIRLCKGKIYIAFKKGVVFKDAKKWTSEEISKIIIEEKVETMEDKDKEELNIDYLFPMKDDEILRDEEKGADAQKEALKKFIEGVFNKIGASDYLKQE